MIHNGKKNCRDHIESSEFLLKDEIEADCNDNRIADKTNLLKQLTLKDTAERPCEESDSALIEQNWNCAENNAEAERRSEND